MSATQRYSQPELFINQVEPRPIGARLAISIVVHVVVLTAMVLGRPVAHLDAPRTTTVVTLVEPPLTYRTPPKPLVVVNRASPLEPSHFTLPSVEPEEPAAAPKLIKDSAPRITPVAAHPQPIDRYEPPPLKEVPQERLAGFANAPLTMANPRARLRVAAGGFSSTVSQTFAGRPSLASRSAGFGSAGRSAVEASSGDRRVASSGGFGAVEAGLEHEVALKSPELQPITSTDVQIISKPRPSYTAAARARKLEGEVVFDLVFGSDGRMHIAQLVQGLGYGLDETARGAALAIKFEPATRDGVAIDTAARVSISFRMAY